SNNLITNDLSKEEKYRIRKLAYQAIIAETWYKVFF
ncbi:unnamed protein product, partial [marine sediment metagenome]